MEAHVEHGCTAGQAVGGQGVRRRSVGSLGVGQDVNQVTVVDVTARINGKLWPKNRTDILVRVEGLGWRA